MLKLTTQHPQLMVRLKAIAREYDSLKLLQTDVLTEIVRSKLNVDRLLLRQQQGFFCVGPSARIFLAVSSNEFFLTHPLQICIPLIIRERQTATVFIWAEISLAVTFSDNTDFTSLESKDYPIPSDLYALIEKEFKDYDKEKYQLYTAELLQEILLGLHSMCKGAESKFFNGHTNITSNRFIVLVKAY